MVANKIRLYYWQGTPNFGDQISPVIVEWVSKARVEVANRYDGCKLLAAGSILGVACERDVVWGAGIRAQYYNKDVINLEPIVPQHLDVRAVRGPLTRDFLLQHDVPCPAIYGDPAILMPLVYPAKQTYRRNVGLVLHFKDRRLVRDAEFIDVGLPWQEVIRKILECKKVISSSLHGIIVAEAYGIPAVWLRLSDEESTLKFVDYYMSTGRCVVPVYSIAEAVRTTPPPLPVFDTKALLKAFPHDVVSSSVTSRRTSRTRNFLRRVLYRLNHSGKRALRKLVITQKY